ncbi:MAG TPA: hypothetical protein VGR72_06470 [Candidatus Acidoferrales bacterium]|nr:hypothetical protein [Candidatus Acidoferrales bacterium]HEV2340494.1 hypothetical protein [Candidatus Acidoferrales bacterium]
MTTTTGIKRAGPPQAAQKVRENYFLVQVLLTSSPSADWRRVFYEVKHDAAAEFQPRSVEISGTLMRFRSEPAGVEQRVAMIDRWVEYANEKEAAMGNRNEEQRRKREEAVREVEELGQWNARWKKL